MAGRKQAEIKRIPPWVFTPAGLTGLSDLIGEWNRRLRDLPKGEPGPAVDPAEEVGRLLTETGRIVARAAGLPETVSPPELLQTDRLTVLPGLCFKLFLFLAGVGLLLVVLSVAVGLPGKLYPPVLLILAGVMAIPYLIYRRTRANIEHEGGYARRPEGGGVIILDRLPRARFRSYLAHEFAHHLHYEAFGDPAEKWMKEGWARLVQCRAVDALADDEDGPHARHCAYLQAVSEMRFAAEAVAGSIGLAPPSSVKKAPTMYKRNPLTRLVTGTPGYNPLVVMEHALGVAVFFFLEKKLGAETVLAAGPKAADLDPFASD